MLRVRDKLKRIRKEGNEVVIPCLVRVRVTLILYTPMQILLSVRPPAEDTSGESTRVMMEGGSATDTSCSV